MTTAPAQSQTKRRRSKPSQPLGEGESSREASAESNDETGQSGLDEDDSSMFAHSRATSLKDGNNFDSRVTKTPKANPSQNLIPESDLELAGGSHAHQGEEGTTETADLSGHEGDVSSAPGGGPGQAASRNPNHNYRAPVLTAAHLTQQTSTASNSTNDSSPPASRHPGHSATAEPPAWAAAPSGFLSALTAEEIQAHIQKAIHGDDGRAYKIKPAPQGRPVRIYADGVYDLLHYGHMLQLRQCKLAFPSVHLLVGVCSDQLVKKFKASPVMTSQERYESVRHCKWVDEVIEDAPWQVDQDFINLHQIDYVAHDEEPYVSAGSEDVYAFAKSIGSFLPTKRTNGVSTSELLQRIVEGYREGDYDGKLRKIGHPELCSRQGSEAGTGRSHFGDEQQTHLMAVDETEPQAQ